MRQCKTTVEKMGKIISVIDQYRLGDIASIVGLLLTVFGFTFTLIIAFKAKTAATQAREAAFKIRDDMILLNTTAGISAAIAIMDEIKRLHRLKQWVLLPDRYSEARKILISVRGMNPSISRRAHKGLQSSITILANLEDDIEKRIAQKTLDADVTIFNKGIRKHVDVLQDLLSEIKVQIKGENHDK